MEIKPNKWCLVDCQATREQYHYVNMYEEENKMAYNEAPKVGHAVEDMPTCDPIIDKYFRKKLQEVKETYKTERIKIIEKSKVGLAAAAYIKTLTDAKPDCYHQNVEDMVPFECLDNKERLLIKKLNETQTDIERELYELKLEIMFLLSQCTTLEQREKIYVRYEILNNIE